jgi:large subunit ribosomal protein L19
MSDLVRKISLLNKKNNHPAFSSGDTVNVHMKVKEGDKERIQVYKGIVTKVQGSGAGRSFTVRKISAGVGVERTFPFLSPSIDKVEVVSHGKVRRSRLFYLRDLKGKAAKIKFNLVNPEAAGSSEAASESAAKA